MGGVGGAGGGDGCHGDGPLPLNCWGLAVDAVVDRFVVGPSGGRIVEARSVGGWRVF